LDIRALNEAVASSIPYFHAPMINLYSHDLRKAVAFYKKFGFVETFRTPCSGDPVHIELTLEGFKRGIATVEAARAEYGLDPHGEGRWVEIVLWTNDIDAAVRDLEDGGAPVLSAAHDFLGGKLRSAWVADPDGNPVQMVQRKP
jgi:predicted enzyme related to lactoylglutathione lyase